MNLAENLKKIRKEHNLSQEQLAEQLNVSRQSVSKWESNQAYPEMDKMIQLCKLFNLNMDDLLNQDISEVNNNKQVKNNINKFIDDFLKYVTKTIDLFSSMKFKTKVKCFFEQVIIIGILILLFLIIGCIGSEIVFSIFSFMPDNLYYPLYNILSGVYMISCIVLGIALVFHIFKIRYLDYYEIVDSKKENNEDKVVEKENRIKQEECATHKKEKIIIRDPKHSEFKFINGILKGLIFIIKAFAVLFGIIFAITMCLLAFGLILSFLLIKTGLLFFGILLCLLSLIVINYIILRIIYNFVFNSKSKKIRLFITFIISLIGIGLGTGLFLLGVMQFNYKEDFNSENYIKETKIIDMNDKIIINDWYSDSINYVESDNNNIKIEYISSKYYELFLDDDNDNVYNFHFYLNEELIMELIRDTIKNFNNKEIVDYSKHQVNVYTSKENINKLKDNYLKYHHYGY